MPNTDDLNRTVFISDNLPFLQSLDTESVDLVIIDPPFGKRQTFTGTLKPPLSDLEREQERARMVEWGVYDIASAYELGIEYPDQSGNTALFKDIWRFERVVGEGLVGENPRHPRLVADTVHAADAWRRRGGVYRVHGAANDRDSAHPARDGERISPLRPRGERISAPDDGRGVWDRKFQERDCLEKNGARLQRVSIHGARLQREYGYNPVLREIRISVLRHVAGDGALRPGLFREGVQAFGRRWQILLGHRSQPPKRQPAPQFALRIQRLLPAASLRLESRARANGGVGTRRRPCRQRRSTVPQDTPGPGANPQRSVGRYIGGERKRAKRAIRLRNRRRSRGA